MGSNREIKVLSELSATSSSTAGSSGPHDPTFLGEKVHTSENKAERREYHSFPTDARKYIDELLGPEAKTKFDNMSVVSEETTRLDRTLGEGDLSKVIGIGGNALLPSYHLPLNIRLGHGCTTTQIKAIF